MKSFYKIILLIISFYFSVSVNAQNLNLIAPITISLPANPPANTADWATAMPPVMIMAQTKMQNGRLPVELEYSRVLVTITTAGVKFCGSFTQQTAPLANFNSVIKTWSGAAVLSLLGTDCVLKPGTYNLCVQFFYLGPAGPKIQGEACKTFTIADPKQQTFIPPQNIMPGDGKVFTQQESNMPIMFRWTPVLPKPQGDVLYKVRVLEIRKGQSKTQAIKTNTAVDIFEVKNSTQISAKLSQRCNGCEYAWDVQAESAERGQGEKPRSYGNSEGSAFSVKSVDPIPVKFNPPVNQSPVDGKVFNGKEAAQPIVLKWTPVVPKPKEDVLYKVRVLEIRKGQSRVQALKTNTPVEVVEVKNETQATFKLAQRCNGCEYLWDVTAIGTERAQGGEPRSYGTSGMTAFKIIVDESNVGSCIKLDTSKYTVVCKGLNTNGQYVYQVQGLIFNKIAANTDPFMESGPTGGPTVNYVTPIVPASATIANIIPPSITASTASVQTVSFDVISSTVLSVFTVNLQMSTYHLSAAGSKIYCSKNFEMTFDAPTCGCQTCDSVKIELGQPTLNQQNSDVNILQPISTLALPSNTPLKIKSLTAEIIYLDIEKDAPECYQCEKNSDHLGKFLSGGIMPNIMMITNSLPADELVYNAVTPQALSNTVFGFVIAMPDLNRCCKDTVNVCIRYTIVTEDCKSCSVTQCYKLPRSK